MDKSYVEAAALNWLSEFKKGLDAHGKHLSVEALEELRRKIQKILIKMTK